MTVSFDEFLSRPKNSSEGNSGLFDHSLKTARRARELAESLGFGDTAFYAGLLHDIGKLNPYYQIFFSTGQVDETYLRAHAIFSALAVNRLLGSTFLSKHVQAQVLFAVAGHHTKLSQFTKSLNYIGHDPKRFEASCKGTYDNLQLFSNKVHEMVEFKDLSWDKCLRKFQNIPLNEGNVMAEGDAVLDFLDFSSVFSALIHADRGSFFDNLSQPNFDLTLNTDVLIRAGSQLSDIRRDFQERILSENNFKDNLVILQAPTGIGKTKLFLDIINKLSASQCFERVFYFSPLLALTDDFESKLFNSEKNASVINQFDAEKVLVYNHAFTGSLLKKKLAKDQGVWLDDEAEDLKFFNTKEYFDRESFNKPLIITTTQRLLMVLYSNTPDDKRKLVSFKNSFLIIDEVQTIPKILLPNFIELLKAIATKYHSRILLVSATIPDELQNLPKLYAPKKLEKIYLKRTVKKIEYINSFDSANITPSGKNARTIFMFNTRRKALGFFEKIRPEATDVLYLSSGIRKCDRSNIIQQKLQSKEGNKSVTVVSTQVLEAGVDVSFTRMYRELAPLDNIVQAMGRLSREGECSDPLLTVFVADGRPEPYSTLEVEESKKLLPTINSSIALYDALPDYYKTVSAENMRNKNLAKDLADKMWRLNFDEIWEFVKKNALPDALGESILIPDPQKYDEIRQQFLSSDSNKGKGKLYTRYAEFMAQLPGVLDKVDGLSDLLDENLLKQNVLLPKKDAINCVYDPKVGLDKWVKK